MLNLKCFKGLSYKVKKASKSTLGVVLVLCLLAVMLPAGIGILPASAASVWDGESLEQPTAGTGYSSNPYWIENAAQLAWLAVNYNSTASLQSGFQTWQQAYYILKADIDLNDKAWTPIGNRDVAFKGHFDGNGYKITGLKVDSTGGTVGLFGKVNVGYQIKNFKNIYVEGFVKGANSVGGIIGNSVGGTTNLENCTFVGTVNGAEGVGGLVGYASGNLNFKNCTSSATVTGTGSYVGGMLGHLWDHNTASTASTLLLEGCRSTGNVTGEDAVGGLVGNVSGYDAAANRTVTVSKSFSAGAITSNGRGGGLIGQVQAYNTATTIAVGIAHSYSVANLTGAPINAGMLGAIFPTLKDTNGYTTANISLNVSNSHFAGKASCATIYNVNGGNCAKIVDTNLTVSRTYYSADSGIWGANKATQRTVEHFADGTITNLLNTGLTNKIWAKGTVGYPIFLTDAVSPKITGLTLSAGALEFDPTDYEYGVFVNDTVDTITVTPVVENGTTIKVNGNAMTGTSVDVPLTNEQTTITVVGERDGIELTYTITVVKAANLWDSSVDTAFDGGSGTEDDPYLIATPAQLAYLSASFAEYAGDYFRLTADLNLGARPWTPIGKHATYHDGTKYVVGEFTGVFDGDGHTISNLFVNVTAENLSTMPSAGLFGAISNATIKNLHVTGEVNSDNGGTTDDLLNGIVRGAAGGIVGRTTAGESIIQNCSFDGTVNKTSGGGAGGIVGMTQNTVSTTIDGCSVNGTITAVGTGAGGIVGDLRSGGSNIPVYITNCYTTGAVSGGTGTGGLVGYSIVWGGGVSTTIRNCYSTMTVTSSNSNSAGLYGYGAGDNSSVKSVTIQNSYFVGTVNSARPIANVLNASATITIDSVYYANDSYTGTDAGGTLGNAAAKSDVDFADGAVTTLLNAGVDALQNSGITGLNHWKNGTEYPIFANMPQITGFTVDCGTIRFDPTVSLYKLFVNETVTSTTVTATGAEGTTVKVNTIDASAAVLIPLTEEENTITITGERDGFTVTYTVLVTRSGDMWDGSIAAAFDGGTGTEEDPYLIANAAQLAYLAQSFANYQNAHFRLTADINLGARLWTPIGKYRTYYDSTTGKYVTGEFSGVFDGDGHTISNLYVNATDDSTPSAGLFGAVATATIKNLNVNGEVSSSRSTAVTEDDPANGVYMGCAGGIVGRTSSGKTIIENCTFEGTVRKTAGGAAGGIVGITQNSTATLIDWCSFNGTIEAAGTGAGGIVGDLRSGSVSVPVTITNCSSNGTVSGGTGTGGLVGYGIVWGGGVNITIYNCYSKMTVRSSNGNSAGLFGYVDHTNIGDTGVKSLSITNSYFAGDVNSAHPVAYVKNPNTAITVETTYYETNSHTGTAGGALGNAQAKEAALFLDGTVRDLLNQGVRVGGGSNWKNGTDGYPVVNSVIVSLNNLILNNGIFNFDPETFAYAVSVPNSVSGLSVVPTAASGISLKVNGQPVQSGSASQTIQLTAGTTTTISIELTRGSDVTYYVINCLRRDPVPAGIWDGSYEAFDTSNGKGTDIDNPILIENAAQLAFLAAMVNGDTVTINGTIHTPPTATEGRGRVYDGLFFKLMADIQLNVTDNYENWETNAPINNWSPIGFSIDDMSRLAESRFFSATLDGDSHTISGLYCVTDDAYHNKGTGLFGAVENGTIRNLHVKQSYVAGYMNVGGLVGSAVSPWFSTNGTTLQNCSYSGTVRSTWVGGGQTNVGGLMGKVYPEAIVNSCWTEGTVIGGDYVGGLAGQVRLRNEGRFENCYSTMTVVTNKTTPNLAAGLIGGLVDEPPYSGTLKLRRCHFAGSVPTGKPIVGNKTERTILNVSSVYYREDSYTAPINEELLFGALEKSLDEFKNGQVTELLNQAKKYGDFWNWKDGENGYPVSDGIILVTDFKTYTDDSEFDNHTWADKFVNMDTGVLIGDDDSGNVSDDDTDNSQTGEKPVYIAVIAVLLISAVLVFFLARKKRTAN